MAHRDLIVGETLATQFGSAGRDHALATPAAGLADRDVVVGDNQPGAILVVKR